MRERNMSTCEAVKEDHNHCHVNEDFELRKSMEKRTEAESTMYSRGSSVHRSTCINKLD